MSEEKQKTLVDELDELIEIDTATLEKVSFTDVKRPLVFGKNDSFEFELLELGAYIVPAKKTVVGTQDMYVLVTNPKIYCFRNALKQLEKFVKGKKLPTKIKYLGREGEGFDTIYNFEVTK